MMLSNSAPQRKETPIQETNPNSIGGVIFQFVNLLGFCLICDDSI